MCFTLAHFLFYSLTYVTTSDTITIIEVTGISDTSQSFSVSLFCFVCIVIITFNRGSTVLTSFEIHNIVLLTISTMLHSRSLKLIHLAYLKLYTQSMSYTSQISITWSTYTCRLHGTVSLRHRESESAWNL